MMMHDERKSLFLDAADFDSILVEIVLAPIDHHASQGLYFGAELPASHPMVRAGIPMHGANIFPPDQVFV